jgi:hypothetical protein
MSFRFRLSMTAAALTATVLAGTACAATTPRDQFNGRQTYSGSNMTCLIANDFYAVHFSALQEGRQAGERTDFEKYCQEVPKVGKVFLSMDLLDRDTRATPIALSVVEEEISSEGRPPEIKSTLSDVPAKIYKTGTADTHVTIDHPGHYALIATIGDGPIMEDDRLRIPFSVGLPPPSSIGKHMGAITGAITALFFAVMGIIGYRVWRNYRPRHGAAEPVGSKAGSV